LHLQSPQQDFDAKQVPIAIAQAAPVYLDKRASLNKALTLIHEASKQGALLVAFGESWLSGYPAWLDVCKGAALWDHTPAKRVFARFRESSISVPGPEVDLLCEAARDLKIAVVIGVNEHVESGPGNGTLYNSLLTITHHGKIGNHHRKLVPTYTERLVWGQGDGRGFEAVATPFGRVGGLICWEHWMPLSRMALHESGEHIHVAVWPTVHDLHQLASRHYAFEGRCFVLAVGLLMKTDDLPTELCAQSEIDNELGGWLERGGSAVIGPDSQYVVDPLFGQEKLIVADLNLAHIDQEKMTLDVSGHYARPDVFRFEKK